MFENTGTLSSFKEMPVDFQFTTKSVKFLSQWRRETGRASDEDQAEKRSKTVKNNRNFAF